MPTSQNGCSKKAESKPLLELVAKTAAEHDMFQPGDRVLAAVSGGPDSVALLYLLGELVPRMDLTLGVAHLNHGLRPEAQDEADFAGTLARNLTLPFHCEARDVAAYKQHHGLSLEEAAREVRYTFYNKIAAAEGYHKVALGHHRDDNAEMVLMNLLRGAGPLGLSGIPPVRDKLIVRPLINITRSQIMAYLQQRRLTYVTDTTNADLRFTRNRIRHVLLPLIRKDFNPGISAALHRTATIIADENAWIESQADLLWDRSVLTADSRQLSLDPAVLAGMPRAAARRLLRRAVCKLGVSLRRITFSHVDRLYGLISAGENARVDLPGLISAVKQDDRLILRVMDTPRQAVVERDPKNESYEYVIELDQIAASGSCDQFIDATGGKLIFVRHTGTQAPAMSTPGHYTALFDIDLLSFPLVIRNSRPGDRMHPLGMHGTKKLKKLFNEGKVPLPDRERWPVLTGGPEILWLPGHQRSQTGALNRQTRRVLEVKYVLPDPK